MGEGSSPGMISTIAIMNLLYYPPGFLRSEAPKYDQSVI